MKKRILCFGDSLTWGWKATSEGLLIERYSSEERWTGVLAKELGGEFQVLEEGLSGRTTDLDDPLDNRLNGAAYLPTALASHLPLDLVVIMLGTNDTKVYFDRSAFEISAAIRKLMTLVAMSAIGVSPVYSAPKVLLMAPPPLSAIIPNRWVADLFEGGRQKTIELARCIGNLSSLFDTPFIDVGQILSTEGADGIHLSGQNNQMLGMELADYIRSKIL
ncbi:SGNH/GDSL hydrolase family protein [uncultured Rhodoferax sp.]|uniref:SGNH/GDSL hydrolase family protein n=1 Tax=uncultured Rhodoferax sp. TaxID=223188 RepID=UPI0025FC7FF0|nr:SGNH/GDSL hydrolase family protein [uncultured Rhodoferax sp.]